MGQVRARDTENAANFLTSLETFNFPRRTLLLGVKYLVAVLVTC